MKITQKDIISVIADANIPVDINRLDPQKELVKQGVDSLDMMNLLFALEEKFKIKIGEKDIEAGNFATIDKIACKINKLIE